MAKSTMLIIGNNADGHKHVSVLDTENLYSYASVVFEMSSINDTRPPANSGSAISRGQGRPYIASVIAKLSELVKWADQGHTLIIALDCLPGFSYVDDDTNVRQWQAGTLAVIKSLNIQQAKGDTADAAQGFEGLALWASNAVYLYAMSNETLTPVFMASAALKGNEKIVAGRFKMGKGMIYVIPPLAQSLPSTRAAYYAAVANYVYTPEVKVSTPPWLASYVTPAEKIAVASIQKKSTEIATLQRDVAGLETELSEFEADKSLFFSHDDAFVKAVSEGLSELGFVVVPGPPYRADLLAYDGSTLLAIEAKGLEGPAKERDFRQALLWKAEVEAALTADDDDLARNDDYRLYADALQKLNIPIHQQELILECRATVIIGTFRTTPLIARKEPDFPDAMERVIIRSRGTGIAGLTLYQMVLLARANPATKEELRLRFRTDGIVLGHAWENFLALAPGALAPAV